MPQLHECSWNKGLINDCSSAIDDDDDDDDGGDDDDDDNDEGDDGSVIDSEYSSSL